jgi:hypothetical protein
MMAWRDLFQGPEESDLTPETCERGIRGGRREVKGGLLEMEPQARDADGAPPFPIYALNMHLLRFLPALVDPYVKTNALGRVKVGHLSRTSEEARRRHLLKVGLLPERCRPSNNKAVAGSLC